ncbi:MAG: translation initiation factor IF-2 [Candidatus Tectomicrobia bacterium]|nr:translation initiation factor IF-2 [Candidatus Tectomicrobia bacterium]
MANIRVYQLAKELEIDSKQLMAELKKRGVDVTTHMNAIDASVAGELRAYYNRGGVSSGARQSPAGERAAGATAVAAPPAAPPATPMKKAAPQATPRAFVIPKKQPLRAEPSKGLPPRKEGRGIGAAAVLPKAPKAKVPVPAKPGVAWPPAAEEEGVESRAPGYADVVERARAGAAVIPQPEVAEEAAAHRREEEELPPHVGAVVAPAEVKEEAEEREEAAAVRDLTMPIEAPPVAPIPEQPRQIVVEEPLGGAAETIAAPLPEVEVPRAPVWPAPPKPRPVPPRHAAPPTRRAPRERMPAPPKPPRSKPVSPIPAAAAAPAGEAPPAPAEVTEAAPKKVRIGEAVTVKELAELLKVKSAEVIRHLLEMGIISTINQIVETDAAVQVAKKFEIEAEVVSVEEDEVLAEIEEETAEWQPRPPVVTVMGHVDHGKTKLLDAIRNSNVMESEHGGITQHIGAYLVKTPRGAVTFLDTPGHEAFTAMRARGAQVTDVVILVVAADDGVMPQTREAVAHARAAQVPIVVAINKIDKENANPERVRHELTELGLLPEEWGGDTIFCEVSAKEQLGTDRLLEMLLLQAEILELKANPQRTAKGVVIEAKLDRSKGPVATVLIQHGSLRVGDAFVCGVHTGRVRALLDDRGKRVELAPPSMPVEVLGLGGVPNAGDLFVVMQDEKRARQIASARASRRREAGLAKSARVNLEDLYEKIKQGEVKELNLVLKADVQGSAEVLGASFEKLGNEEVRVRIIHSSVGGINDSDVLLASASNAVIIGFNVRPMPSAEELAAREKVEINLYSVIYDALNHVKSALEGMLAPRQKEVPLGRAEVREVFTIQKVGAVAGCYLHEGLVRRDALARIYRDNVLVYTGKVGSLRRFKEDVREVGSGFECGVSIEKFNDIKQNDILEFYRVEEEARTL